MQDVVVVPFPRQDWALCAIEDLRREGCQAELLPAPTADGSWCLQITGPEDRIHLIRQSMQPIERVCWETFVNACVAS
jgi:hypothetical protein